MIHKIEQWKQSDITVYLFGDYHLASTQNNVAQKRDLITYAQQLDAALIVEDGFVVDSRQILSLDPSIDQLFFFAQLPVLMSDKNHKKLTTIVGLSSWALHASIPCINVEFRFDGLRPLSTYFPIIAQTKEKIRLYNDGAELNNYYIAQLELIETIEKKASTMFKVLESLSQGAYAHKSIYDAIKENESLFGDDESITNCFNELLTELPWDITKFSRADRIISIFIRYCALLLDCKLTHAVNFYVTQISKKNIFICAGSLHTDALHEPFRLMGFTKTAEIGENRTIKEGHIAIEPKGLNIAKSLNSVHCGPRKWFYQRNWSGIKVSALLGLKNLID